MATIFTRIVDGEIPCYRVAENEEFLAFLDVNPLVMGHTLVIPKREENYIFNLEADELGRMVQFAQVVAKKIGSAIECKRVGVTVIGLEVPHAHIHLIPINCEADMNFSNTKLRPTEDQFKEVLAKLEVE